MDLRAVYREMSRPPSWLRGSGEVGCLRFLQTVPWAGDEDKCKEYATWLVENGADSIDSIAALDAASFSSSPLLPLHVPVLIRTAVKAVDARDGAPVGGSGSHPPPPPVGNSFGTFAAKATAVWHKGV